VTSTHLMSARWSRLAGARLVGTRLTSVALATALAGSVLAIAAVPVSSASASVTARHHPVTLRVASYNIHAGAGQDNVFDLDRTAAEIAGLRADVVGLQEVDVHWSARSGWRNTLQELGSRLHMGFAFAPIYALDPPAPGQPRRRHGVALLSRHPIVARVNHEITRLSTQVPDPLPAPAPGFLEAVVQVRDVGAHDGAHVYTHVYVTHLDFRGDPSVRRLQVADMRRILAQDPAGTKQLLLGDLNAEPTAPELAPLWQSVRDGWAHAPVRSGTGLTYPAAAPTKRIDYVTASPNIAIVAATVPADGGHPHANTASDHRPMVATVRIPRELENDP
jgi:endonuclease/exonuclease/phosphatase family metal-dependent hydrolase